MERLLLLAAAGVSVIAIIVRFRQAALSRRRQTDSFIVTGLRAVDLFAPLPRGGDILMTGDQGAGLVIMGLEVVSRLLKHPREDFHVAYFLDEGLSDLDVRTQEMQEVLPEFTKRFTVSMVSEEQLEQMLLGAALRHTVIFVATDNLRFQQVFRDAIRHVREDSAISKRLTTITLTNSRATSEFDARIECSRMIAKQGIYPAIDVRTSFSSVYNTHDRLRRQYQVATSAAAAITELMRSIYEGAVQDSSWAYNQNSKQRPALQLLCFMSQTFSTAEPYTGKQGVHVPIAETVNDFEMILSGQKKEIPANRFFYADSLPRE